MGKDSSIQWTDHTFNPWFGCTKVSPGCVNCYAEAGAKRNPAVLGVWGPAGSRRFAAPAYWRQPLSWNVEAHHSAVRRRVFCASYADVFEEWPGRMVDSQGNVLWDVQGQVVGAGKTTPGLVRGERVATMADARRMLARTISSTQNLDWLLLTKRPENARGMVYEMWFEQAHWPRNYWVGTTVEDRKHGLPRIDTLREFVEAPIRFLSVEPLIEDLGRLDLTGIDWVIVGGESGSKARPFNVRWARDIVAQCREQRVAVFVKQLGRRPYDSARTIDITGPGSHSIALALDDSHGGDWDEWPADLRIREFPTPRPSSSLVGA